MATQILATGSTAADSSDVVVAPGVPVTVVMKGATSGSNRCIWSIKDDAGTYNVMGALAQTDFPLVINGPGTYRFTRAAGDSYGLFTA